MITLTPGQSGYFSKPSPTLDPHLFNSKEQLYPDVRSRITRPLYEYLGLKYRNPESWTMAWLAGSGISYQWAASRGNGDLDVLFGIDFNQFVNDNPEYRWYDRGEIANMIDADLKDRLWPMTAHEPFYFGEFDIQYYEVTYFLNQYVEDDPDSIVNIKPYAAYNLNYDEWTVRPPKIPNIHHPQEYEAAADANREAALALITRYNNIGTGVNAENHRKFIRTQAQNLFDTIHLGRKNAFSQHGEGYGDYYNYQWQRAKQDGIVNALNELLGKE